VFWRGREPIGLGVGGSSGVKRLMCVLYDKRIPTKGKFCRSVVRPATLCDSCRMSDGRWTRK